MESTARRPVRARGSRWIPDFQCARAGVRDLHFRRRMTGARHPWDLPGRDESSQQDLSDTMVAHLPQGHCAAHTASACGGASSHLESATTPVASEIGGVVEWDGCIPSRSVHASGRAGVQRSAETCIRRFARGVGKSCVVECFCRLHPVHLVFAMSS